MEPRTGTALSTKTRMVTETETFPWQETRDRLGLLWKEQPLVLADRGRVPCLVDDPENPTIQVWLPFVLQRETLREGMKIPEVLEALPESPGQGVIVLVRAGATALGVWNDDELLRHKVIKRYVVRGKGKAQPMHLKTKGKSRYGSRLRLQGYKAQLEETIGRLLEWREEYGKPDQFLLSCGKRLLGDLRQMDPPLPTDVEARRIPFEVRESSFEELTRIRKRTEWGRIERLVEAPPEEKPSPESGNDGASIDVPATPDGFAGDVSSDSDSPEVASD